MARGGRRPNRDDKVEVGGRAFRISDEDTEESVGVEENVNEPEVSVSVEDTPVPTPPVPPQVPPSVTAPDVVVVDSNDVPISSGSGGKFTMKDGKRVRVSD